jgi:hypothetical protein
MAYIYDLTDTWNAGGTTFNGIKLNVTDTSSAVSSKLVTLQTNGTEHFSVTKAGVGYFSGNVGIANTTPRGLLHIGTTASATDIPVPAGNFAIVRAGAYGSASTGGIQLSGGYGDAGRVAAWQVKAVGSGTAGSFVNDLLFTTQNSFSGSETERMRIDSSGNLLVGKTAAGNYTNGCQIYANGETIGLGHASSTGSGASYMLFGYDNGGIGSITQSGTTAVLYNTSSDARLKHDIVDAPEASSLIDAIQVRSFKWNADNSEQRYGFIAQELVEVAPEAVSQPEDPDAMMGVDYSKLVPMLVKELQSLRARVAQLEGTA